MSDPDSQTGRLARFITTLTFEAIPGHLLDLGRISILDALGCGLSGSTSGGASILNAYLKQYEHVNGAVVIGTERRDTVATCFNRDGMNPEHLSNAT